VPRAKPPDTVRIACLGGSTTGRGYPRRMQALLQEQAGDKWRFEAMNFGLGWYTSAHSVVNFVLNVVDYAPDYVVFHHAWNDARARNVDGPVRGDYGHAFRAFEAPSVPDALLIRGSVLYRWLKDRMFGEPNWAFLDRAVLRPRRQRSGPPFGDTTELEPYVRNVRTIVEVARARGIVPVLTTQPHTLDPDTPGFAAAVHIRQCNQIVRALAREYGDRVLFVDLDAAFTGKNELFIDLGHMAERGMREKAAAIGDAILAHWRERPH